jgi:hypothetical protein
MAVSDADILGWLNANPGADDTLIANTMRDAGVDPARMAQVTGLDYGDVAQRYETALAPLSAVTQGNNTVLEDTSNNYYGDYDSNTNTGATTGALAQASTVTAPNYDQIIQNAYGTIGRTGLGEATNQIDQGGYNHFLNMLQTGAVKPEEFSNVFSGAVDRYIADNPNDRYTQYVNSYRGSTGNTDTSGATTATTGALTTVTNNTANTATTGATDATGALTQAATGSTTGSTTADTAVTNGYLKANPDVAAAYLANNGGMTQDQYAQSHFTNSGAEEGRKSPFLESGAFANAIDLKNGTYLASNGDIVNSEGTKISSTGSAVTSKLASQILGQGTTSKWSGQGFGSAEANATDMAKILAGIGITDINQFGKVPVYAPVQVINQFYNGQQVTTTTNDEGQTVSYVRQPTGEYEYNYETGENRPVTKFVPVPSDAKLETVYGLYDGNETVTPVDPSKLITKDGKLVVDTGQTTFGNTVTGQAVPNTYSERQTGNAFGGTFAGSGNTGYRVDFSQGTPIFYTTGASSNDLVNLFADNPLLGAVANVAAGYFGGPAGVAALQAAMGKGIEDIAKSAVLAYAGGQIAGNISGSTELIGSVGADAANVIGRSVGKYVSSEGKADIIQSLAGGAVDLGVGKITDLIPDFGNLSQGVQDFTKTVVATTIKNGGDLSMTDLVDAAFKAGTAATKAATTGTIATAIAADKTVNDAVTAELDKQMTIDASGAMDVNAAAKFAEDSGYNKFTFDGKTYTLGNNNAENTIAQLESDALATNTAANLKGGEFEGVDAAVAANAKANNTVIGNAEADNPEEAAYLAKQRNPTGTTFTYGGNTYTMGASSAAVDTAFNQAKTEELKNNIANAPTRAEAFKLAREGGLGANDVFTWQGKSYTAATADEVNKTSATTATGANSTITNYVNDKLSKNLTSAEFNPADLTKDEMAKFVNTYANATDAQKATLLKGADSMTFKVIDTLLKQTAALNPTGKGDVAAPAGSTDLKAWDKGSIATAVDVAKAAGNVAAADIAGLGVRGAQFLGDLMGQDTNSFAGVQNLLVNDKDKSMSKLVGNEKVVAGGIASGVESAVAFTLGGPYAAVATIAGVVANNSWVEGSNAGLSVTDNAKRTAAITSIEVAGELLGIPGMKAIMKGIPVTGSVTQIVDTLKRFGGGLLSENATELLTTVAQFGVDKFATFGLSKDATFDDFQTALKDTIIATTSAVGTSSGIATATRAASGASTKQIADADRTAVSPDTSLLTSGASFGAKPGDTSNQGLNQVTPEAIDFNKLDPSKQTTILDSLRSNIANISLAASLSLGSLASATEVESYVNNSIQTAASTGANVENAINKSVSGSINSAINNKVSTETAINSAVSSAVTSAFNNNVSTTTAINSAVTSAVNTASTNAASTTAAVTTAVESAVSTAISTAVTNNTMTAATVNQAVNTAVTSAVQAAVANNVSTTTAVNTAVTAAVTAAVANNVSTTAAVNAAVAAVTNLNVNVAAVTALATNVATETVAKTELITSINDLISTPPKIVDPSQPPVTPPVPPVVPPVVNPPVVVPPVVVPPVVTPPVVNPPTTSSKKSSNYTPSVMAGAMFAGDLGRLPPQMLKAYMTKDKFVDPLAKLQALQEDMNTEKMQASPQVNTQEPDMPDQGTWKYGTAPDDLDSLFGEKSEEVEGSLGFKAGGYVAPLQMASGGAMPLPLLVKSGGALGALPRGDGRLDFRHGAHVAGEGDGQSDDIKAMLADGEFVFPADVVSALGNGSTKAGSDKLYEMMHSIRARARSKKPKDLPPPALKSPLDYLKKVRSK